MERLQLRRLITVVDSKMFLTQYNSKDMIAHRPDLGEDQSGESGYRKVVELLVEQVECSDVIIMNKTDLVLEKNRDLLSGLLRSLNSFAPIIPSQHGQVSIKRILDATPAPDGAEDSAPTKHSSVTNWSLDEEHRAALRSAKRQRLHAKADTAVKAAEAAAKNKDESK